LSWFQVQLVVERYLARKITLAKRRMIAAESANPQGTRRHKLGRASRFKIDVGGKIVVAACAGRTIRTRQCIIPALMFVMTRAAARHGSGAFILMVHRSAVTRSAAILTDFAPHGEEIVTSERTCWYMTGIAMLVPGGVDGDRLSRR
jgi:hypothetical protein